MDILDGYHPSRGLSNSDHQYHLMARRRSWLFAFLVREREDKHHQRWFTALILIHYADTWRGTRGPRPRVQSAVMEILFRHRDPVLFAHETLLQPWLCSLHPLTRLMTRYSEDTGWSHYGPEDIQVNYPDHVPSNLGWLGKMHHFCQAHFLFSSGMWK